MTNEVQKFIEENIDLIDLNTKESWEEIYDKIPKKIKGEFTKTLLDASIDPAAILGYVPENYLSKSNIVNYKIPDNVTSIGYSAFRYCNSLTSVVIPDSVTSIGEWAFAQCASLTSVVIGDSVTSIGWAAFYMCYSLLNIDIPDNVENLGASAFNSCQHLRRVILGNHVKYIYESTFSGCPNLIEVIIHSDCINTISYSFSYCDNLKEIQFKGTKKEAIECGIGDRSRTKWREGSPIEKIICSDGEILL